MKVCLGNASNSNNMYVARYELESVTVIVVSMVITKTTTTKNICRQGRVSLGYLTRNSPT